MPHQQLQNTLHRLYTEQTLRSVGRLRFPEVVEREFQESFYNPRAHEFITRWGLLPGFVILLAFCIGDIIGFSEKLILIESIRVISMVPLLLLYKYKLNVWVYRHIRNLYSAYLLLLAFSVGTIIAISPHTDFAHRGYMLSLPMLIITTFLAKPKIQIGVATSVLFCLCFDVANLLLDFKPLGFGEVVSMVHFNLVMLSSIVIGAFTAYVLEVAERREFLQRKIIDQDKELILLQQLELSEAVNELRSVNDQLALNNERLDQLNREKDVFLGIAAHDLKNPLTGISVNIAGIKRHIAKMSQGDLLAAMDRIDLAATRMRRLIVQLLDINKLEHGSMEINPQRVLMSELLLSVQHDYQLQASEKNLKLMVECEAGLWSWADSSMLMQVLDNLVSNAIKFSAQHRVIRLRAHMMNVDNTQWVKVCIQDEGPGISADDIDKLFKRFTKLSAKPTAGEHSSGLGLSIAKMLIDRMEGSIHCESEVGKGTSFVLLLPPAEKCATSPIVRDVDRELQRADVCSAPDQPKHAQFGSSRL